ncbi:hypothetical protein UFOVP176_31 [uncultured Caudovirales phage]|uniref:Uncharacterized protein n=1 Tax=uncultured Caudovirales phage TaxID=2100421 RepID=A0A6J7WC94_9CAUD|nr:hypothetical protein UFOVP176_31 [uncultured Caudovirales phage]
MAIIQTIDTASQFRDQFHRYGRGDQFSYEALGLIFDYLNDCGSDVELDVIAICCEFSEESWEQVTTNYSFDIDSLEDLDEDEKIKVVRSYLEDNTSVVGETSTGSFVFVQF